MANIRFVKPPNDNRIRSLPAFGIAPTAVPKENFFNTSSAPAVSTVIDTRTSKQKSNTHTTDIFTTSRKNDYQSGVASSQDHEETSCKSDHKYDNSIGQTNNNFASTRRESFQKLTSNNLFTINQNIHQKAMNSNVGSDLPADDNENSNSPSTTERNNNNFDKTSRNRTESCSNHNDNIAETTVGTNDSEDECRANTSSQLLKHHKEQSETEPSFMSFDSEQSDDPGEEDDKFPELQSLFDNMESSVCHENHPMLVQQSDQLNRHNKDAQEKQLVTSSASPSLTGAFQDRQKQQLSYLFQSGARSRHGRNYRPIHRSISDAALIENNRLTSFFKSFTDDKYYGLDEEDYDDEDDADINLIETSDSIKKNELRRLTQPLKLAWESSIQNHQEGNMSDKPKEKTTQQEATKPPASKPEGHFLFSRSLSGDSMLADRLRIRRCALADPENMIMRQEVREKIEREVERRRSSMVRKISQFFNVHLGLNKEEDLI
ncbi:hypothetical protein BsWGS_14920 [Bradybaena similaris]